MSKNFSEIAYNSMDIWEFGNDDGRKDEVTVLDNTVTFVDADASTRYVYRIGLFGESGVRVGQTAWDSGFYPTTILFTAEDGTTKEYNITKGGS